MNTVDLTNDIRTFVIVKEDGTESGQYKGTTPRQAAFKATKALAGTKDKPVEFKLRERGDHLRMHVFSGYTEVVKTPANKPAWMKGDTMVVARIKKLRIERIKTKEE